MVLDCKLKFLYDINEKIEKTTKCINIKMNLPLPQYFVLTIYKSFVRTHLDYGNVI